jgi:hypothetical protein
MDSEDSKFGRDLAVQTLLDLHPNGSAYRVAKIMVSSHDVFVDTLADNSIDCL